MMQFFGTRAEKKKMDIDFQLISQQRIDKRLEVIVLLCCACLRGRKPSDNVFKVDTM